jgi:hypothetical protein
MFKFFVPAHCPSCAATGSVVLETIIKGGVVELCWHCRSCGRDWPVKPEEQERRRGAARPRTQNTGRSPPTQRRPLNQRSLNATAKLTRTPPTRPRDRFGDLAATLRIEALVYEVPRTFDVRAGVRPCATSPVRGAHLRPCLITRLPFWSGSDQVRSPISRDSKSRSLRGVWVRFPPPAPAFARVSGEGCPPACPPELNERRRESSEVTRRRTFPLTERPSIAPSTRAPRTAGSRVRRSRRRCAR